jgi:SAM-dependent methyltransferase
MAAAAEREIAANETLPGWCAACRKPATFRVGQPEGNWSNLREGLVCDCGLNGRMRLIFLALEEVAPRRDFLVLERVTVLYRKLAERFPQVQGSEFLGAGRKPGEIVQLGAASVRHESIEALSVADDSLDCIFHGDILEHVPHPDRALRECFRALRPGGVLVFTCPFFDLERHVVRCEIIDGALRHHLPPAFHGNPVEPGGSLVFTHHGWPLIDDVRAAGFDEVKIGLCYDVHQGIVSNANPYSEGLMWPVIFRATKGGRPR